MKTQTIEFDLTQVNSAITNSTLHLSLMNNLYAAEPKFIITILGSTLKKKHIFFSLKKTIVFVLNEEPFKYR